MPEGTAILPLAREHWEAVLRLNGENPAALAPLDPAELSRLSGLGGRHWVAVDRQGAVLGYLLSFPRAARYDGEEFLHFGRVLTGEFLYVDQVAVARICQGRNIGRGLYQALIAAAAEQGVGTLCCEVNLAPPNPGSLAFHRRLGFSPLGRLATVNGRTVALLIKTL